MHFLSAALFASGAMAVAVARSGDSRDCVLANTNEMAAEASCGDASALSACFSQLEYSSAEALAKCYAESGCSSVDAQDLAQGAERRCVERFGRVELKRRSRGELDARGPRPTQAPEFAAMNMFWEGGHIFPRSAATGDDCFTFKDKVTRVCDVKTNSGKESTGDCSTITTSVSSCHPDKTCTLDTNGEHICMDLENDLDVGGIIVTIIFGVAIVAGIASITFLCCKDRKEQKRLAAKAATIDLHRAATKKKKEAAARAQRTPLMQQEQERQRDPSVGSTDPFHDRNRS